MRRLALLFRLLCLVVLQPLLLTTVHGFQQLSHDFLTSPRAITRTARSSSLLWMAESDKEKKPEYSREIYLREEAESPFRKVRIFFYYSVGAGALFSLAISAARVAAALSGINADLLQESATNVAIDAAGLAVLAALYKRDMAAQESRLQRASKGAELAKLMVRARKSISTGGFDDDDNNDKPETFTTSLASLRRGRGIEKRVVIAAAGKETINKVIQDARRLDDSLSVNDLLIVPVILPTGVSPEVPNEKDDEPLPECIALPVGVTWRSLIKDETEQAVAQGVDVEKEGFCVILKKNGRVGQRTKGIFLENMVADVTQRLEMGMDVKNI